MAKKKTDKVEENIAVAEEVISKSERFIEDNQKTLTYVLVGIVAVVAIIFGYHEFVMKPKEKEASSQIFRAQQYFSRDSLKLALNGDNELPGFLEIEEQYGSTDVGNLSKLYIGIIYRNQGEFQKAIDYLDDFSSDDQILRPMAKGAIGDSYMELGNTEKALEYYNKAAETKINNFTTPMFLLKAAWTHEELGDYKMALEVYNKIKDEYSRSTEARDIEKYIKRAEGLINK